MSDNKKIRAPHDKKRIDIRDPQELRNWANALDCTQTAIKNAVKKVGTSAAAVRKQIKGK